MNDLKFTTAGDYMKTNERIQSLADEAKKSAFDAMIKITDREQALKAYSETYDTEFASLIVRECTDVALEQKKCVEDQKVHNSNDKSWNKARIQQSQLIVNKIRQHFGVEE